MVVTLLDSPLIHYFRRPAAVKLPDKKVLLFFPADILEFEAV
ncbi:hypothetical protein l11_03990 [Neisseria weaveri LMG 5135]|nr:hypothetical protein l13_11790 [Neisseria weaveri ATCC 51223]EGV38597.1 hypothetical protein l11_03990 [Neisseria weaveri LMG 5135]